MLNFLPFFWKHFRSYCRYIRLIFLSLSFALSLSSLSLPSPLSEGINLGSLHKRHDPHRIHSVARGPDFARAIAFVRRLWNTAFRALRTSWPKWSGAPGTWNILPPSSLSIRQILSNTNKSCINPHHTVTMAVSCMCSQISCDPSCLHMQQLCLCKWPFIWTVAAFVYITPRTNIFRVTFSIKFQNSTLVYSSISYTTSILEACKLSLLCRTFQIAVSGMPRCKLLRTTKILLTKLTRQPRAFTLFSGVHGRRDGLRFSTSTFSLNCLIEPGIAWPTGGQSRCNAAMDLLSASRLMHSAFCCTSSPPYWLKVRQARSLPAESILRLRMKYEQRDACARVEENFTNWGTCYRKFLPVKVLLHFETMPIILHEPVYTAGMRLCCNTYSVRQN
jgi:hypothetical protein